MKKHQWNKELLQLLYRWKTLTIEMLLIITNTKHSRAIIYALNNLIKNGLVERKQIRTSTNIFLYRLTRNGIKKINPYFTGNCDYYDFLKIQHNTETLKYLNELNKILNNTTTLNEKDYFTPYELHTAIKNWSSFTNYVKYEQTGHSYFDKEKAIIRTPDGALSYDDENGARNLLAIEYERTKKDTFKIHQILYTFSNSYLSSGASEYIFSAVIIFVSEKTKNKWATIISKLLEDTMTTNLLTTVSDRVFLLYKNEHGQYERFNTAFFKWENIGTGQLKKEIKELKYNDNLYELDTKPKQRTPQHKEKSFRRLERYKLDYGNSDDLEKSPEQRKPERKNKFNIDRSKL